jgi:hypothetical protein
MIQLLLPEVRGAVSSTNPQSGSVISAALTDQPNSTALTKTIELMLESLAIEFSFI